MRDYAVMTSQFWVGETGRELRGHKEAQIVAAYLVTGPSSTMIGLYHMALPILAHETGLPIQGASKGLAKCKEVGFAYYDPQSETVFIPEMAKFQLGAELSAKDKRVKAVVRLASQMRKSPYFKAFLDIYAGPYRLDRKELEANTEHPLTGHRRGIEGGPNQEQEQEHDQEQVQEHEHGEAPPKTNFLDRIDYPEGLDTPQTREAILEWCQYKRRTGSTYKQPAAQISKLLKEDWATDPAAVVAAVNHSIAQNYKGCYPPKGSSNERTDKVAARNQGATFKPGAVGDI